MKKRAFLKRITSVSLALTMAVSLATGCGKEKKGEDSILDDAVSGSKDYVFKMEDMSIDGLDPSRIDTLSIVGDRVVTSAFGEDGNITVFSFNSDGSDVKKTVLPSSDMSFSYMDFDSEGNTYAILVKNYFRDGVYATMGDEDSAEEAPTEASSEEASNEEASEAASEDGSSDLEDDGYAGSSYDESEEDEEYYLAKFDSEGNEVYKVRLGENIAEGDYYYAYSIVYSDKYGVLISSNQDICSYDEQKGFTTLVDTKNKYQDASFNLTRGYNGDIFVSGYTENGRLVGTLDVEKKDIGNVSQLFGNTSYYAFFSGNGYDMYAADDTAVYGYDFKSDKLVKLMDYVDSDLPVQYSLNYLAPLSDTEFISCIPDLDYNYSFVRLTKVPADQVKDRQIITLAGSYIDYHVRQAAIKFNQNNDDYKIKLVDYSTYDTEEDYNAGVKRFNLDIASGNIPDIMTFDLESPVESYINKGLFLDVSTYFNNDPDLSEDDFIGNIMDAFKTGDKMYQVVPYFDIATLMCKASLLNGQTSISMEDYRNILDAKGVSPNKAFAMCLRDDMLAYAIAFSGNDFIDWQNKKCGFDSQAFVDVMEFVKDFPTEYDDSMYMDYETSYREGTALFNISSVYGFDSFKRQKYATFGEDVAFLGFPGSSNTSVIYPGTRLCISAQSKNADGAWKFIKSFLSEEFQDSLDFDFPIRTSSYEKMKKAAMEPEYYEDENGNKVESEEYYYIGDKEYKVPTLTQEDVDQVDNLVKNSHYAMSYNINVNNIISEEGSAFFSGQKTAKEVCDIIQSRLSIYVNENS